MTLLRASLAALCLAAATPAIAQHGAPQHGAATAAGDAADAPFATRAFGAFRMMIHRQDYAAKTTLGAAMAGGTTEAVGAVAGLKGEITALDGRLIVTYGGAGCPACPPPGQESAALLATGRVAAWRAPVTLPSDLSGTDLDAFIVAQARAAGLDVEKPFPARLVGRLTGVKMHVLEAPNPAFAGHGGGHAMAKQDEIVAASLDGLVVGFYAPAAMQGVITHPGEAFHWHWVDPARTRTAHLDAFGMAAGAQLLLPRR
ncbi:MAG: acetolactate decarboxylase [Methylobacteriaceae bacterium]|nr:acetolactate decarboxylase [Methylobacteriaceae bacterium]